MQSNLYNRADHHNNINIYLILLDLEIYILFIH